MNASSDNIDPQRSRLNSSSNPADGKKQGDASEMEDDLREANPLLQVVNDIVGQRVQALQHNGQSKPSLNQFIVRFEEQMAATEFC